jgi:hypothetical protein
LPEPAKFSISELRTWLQKETGSVLTPVQVQAQKRLEETRIALQNLTEASKMLVDNSQKEIEKRNMKVYNRARALNKLANMFVERLKKLDVPTQVSYDNLSAFASEAQKIMVVTDLDIKNWFPHISPFFIMDRRKFQPIFEKTKLTINNLNDYVTKEYVKTKTQEKTFQLLNELNTLQNQLTEIENQKTNLKNERLTIENEISKVEQQTTDQLSQVEIEQETLNNELKNELRHLQKPFIKMQALATSGGGGGITPDELRKLTQYMENPFEAVITEENDTQMLKEILQKLSDLLSQDKLKLKPDKQRKAEQAVDDILKRDILADFHVNCLQVAIRKKQLCASSELENAKHDLSQLQIELEKLRTRKANLQADEALKTAAANEVVEKMRNHKKTIETNVQSFLGKQIQIT